MTKRKQDILLNSVKVAISHVQTFPVFDNISVPRKVLVAEDVRQMLGKSFGQFARRTGDTKDEIDNSGSSSFSQQVRFEDRLGSINPWHFNGSAVAEHHDNIGIYFAHFRHQCIVLSC